MSISVKRSLMASMLVSLLMSLSSAALASGTEAKEVEPEKGPHRGRMLREDDFAIELAIFETGVPPEFRVWASQGGEALPPENVKVSVTLGRLGDGDDLINFKPQDDFLRGDMEIVEPHSFLVVVSAISGSTIILKGARGLMPMWLTPWVSPLVLRVHKCSSSGCRSSVDWSRIPML